MIQFYSKSDPENQYKHIIVDIKCSVVICGFPCVEADETAVYKGERFDYPESPDKARLVAFEITGKELRSLYDLYDPDGNVSLTWKD